jgi:outer membrane receptor protein involved in Fe transport
MHSRLTPSLVVLAGAALAAAVAHAQTTSSTGNPVAESTLKEIVVTAETRSSTIQDTPISISALSGEQLSGFLFADNLTDKRAQLGINTTGFSYTIPSLIRVATNQPRTIGVDLKYRF